MEYRHAINLFNNLNMSLTHGLCDGRLFLQSYFRSKLGVHTSFSYLVSGWAILNSSRVLIKSNDWHFVKGNKVATGGPKAYVGGFKLLSSGGLQTS